MVFFSIHTIYFFLLFSFFQNLPVREDRQIPNQFNYTGGYLMNEKDYELDRIVSVVINCTKSSIWSDNSITREELLGKSKNENACMARAILVSQLVKAGFTISTISGLLRRTAQGIRHIIKTNYSLLKSSRVYKIASGEVEEMCKLGANGV